MARKILYLDSLRTKKIDIMSEQRKLINPSQLHWHGFIEIEIVIDGSGIQILNGHRIKLERGVVTVLRLTDFHQLQPTPMIEILNICLAEKYLSEKTLSSLWKFPESICKQLDESKFSGLKRLGDLLIEENSSSCDIQYMINLIECMLIKILDIRYDSSAKKPISKLHWAVDYMESHFMYDPSLADVASLLHYSEKYFSALFHKEFGLTYSDYLTRLKVEYAKKLLIGTKLGMEIIGNECGFNSASNFRRAFNGICGMSPRDFRELCREQEIRSELDGLIGCTK